MAAENQPGSRFIPLPYVFLSVGLLIGLIAFVRIFVIQTVVILDVSMQPTFHSGDRAACLKTFSRNRLKRGVVLRVDDPRGGELNLAKRLIALPGETFGIVNGQVVINGKQIDEPYIAEPSRLDIQPFLVPDGYVIVLGDNRNRSDDSSIWGPLPVSKIRGKLTSVLWPPGHIKRL